MLVVSATTDLASGSACSSSRSVSLSGDVVDVGED